MFKSKIIVIFISTILVLSMFYLPGCGGGNGNNPPPPKLFDLKVMTKEFTLAGGEIPITGVGVRILGVNVGTYTGITSGDDASVTLSVPEGDYIIKLSKNGYATLYIDCMVSEADEDAIFPMLTWDFMNIAFGGTVDQTKSIIYGTIKKDVYNEVEGVEVNIDPKRGELYYIAEGEDEDEGGVPSKGLSETSKEGQFAYINLDNGTIR